jgi:SAM-dependent methyltransferase
MKCWTTSISGLRTKLEYDEPFGSVVGAHIVRNEAAALGNGKRKRLNRTILYAVMDNWWKTFFDADYIRIWGAADKPTETAEQVQGIWELLALHEGSRVLDAPCGYGRLSLPIARRGAIVVGVDQSEAVLAHAEKNRGGLSIERLRYSRHDLREPLTEGGFDAAFNVFSSIGYGTEEEDLAIVTTLRSALRRGGRMLIDTMHRDAVAAVFSRGAIPAQRLADGTLVVQEPTFDALSGRLNGTWYWSGPTGQGRKSASMRLYTATELVHLLQSSGLQFLSAHHGCSTREFKCEGPEMGGRIAILAECV